MRSQTSRMKTLHSIWTSCMVKPCSATGTTSKLAMSSPQARAPIWLATCVGRVLGSPRKLHEKRSVRCQLLALEQDV